MCSAGPLISTGSSRTLTFGAAGRRSAKKGPLYGLVAGVVLRTATQVRLGTSSRSICKRLPANSESIPESPVAFLPGRAKLSMNPLWTGAPTTMTIGIVLVAAIAALVVCVK
jgi:hypothetical protein